MEISSSRMGKSNGGASLTQCGKYNIWWVDSGMENYKYLATFFNLESAG
jgi:hypothetical protein